MLTIRSRSILEPYKILYERSQDEDRVGTVVLEPCQKGFGTLIANALRRSMFAGLEGFCISCIKIEGVNHEFCGMPGIEEDVIDIIANLKMLRFASVSSGSTFVASISVSGPCTVTGSMIDLPSEISCLNPESVICNISENVKFSMHMVVRCGVGYSENTGVFESDAKLLPESGNPICVTSDYCPIKSVSFSIKETHYGEIHNCEKVEIRVETDGSITPDAAVRRGSALLSRQFSRIAGENEIDVLEPIDPMVEASSGASLEEQMSDKLMKSVDHLDLTVRSYNCLRSAGITTVWALVQMRDTDLLRLPNFGKKSLKEISEILGKMDLSLGMSIPQTVSDLMSSKVDEMTKLQQGGGDL